MNRIALFLGALVAVVPLTLGATDHATNGGFESDGGWGFMTANGCRATGGIDATVARIGKRSYKLTSESDLAAHVYGRATQFAHELRPYTTYRISAWVKGQDVGIAWVGGGPGWYLRAPFPKGTYDWKQVNIDYTTDDLPPDFELMLVVESKTKAVWIDDVSMVEIGADREKRDRVVTDLTAQLASHRRRIDALERAGGDDPYVRLGVAVARRFIARIESPQPFQKQAMSWSKLQANEVGPVLDETEKWLANPNRPKAPVDLGRFLYGFGHFTSVERDLPNFPALGASLIQDGRVGPSSMNPDGTLKPAAVNTVETLDRARQAGMRVDWLLSPHYFPDWAINQSPDVRVNNPGFSASTSITQPPARPSKTGSTPWDRRCAASPRWPASA